MNVSLQHLPALLDLTHRMLAKRVLVFSSLLITAIFFGIAIAFADWLRLAIAATFAVLVFLPCLFRKESSDEQSG